MAKHLAPCARLGSDDRQFISIRATHTLYTALATVSRDGHVSQPSQRVGLRSERGCGVVEQDYSRYRLAAYRSTLLVVGPGNASLLHVAALVAAVKICMGFCVWFFWRRSGRAEPYNRIYNVFTDCTPCQYMSKDSRSPAWPNVPVSECECVPAPLILILRALPFQAGIRQVLIFTANVYNSTLFTRP